MILATMAFRCIRCHAEIEKAFRACPHCGEPVTDFLRRYLDEPVDGKYRILERLGAGGMGEVYKVEHTFLGAIRVIKVIRPQILGNKDVVDRFLREARMATKVQHPNVATLHDFSALPDGSHYMVWEYIDGENLAERLKRVGTLPPSVAVRIAIQTLHALDAIHRAGIVHRDISPENLMLTRGDDRVTIIDLGVAKTDDLQEGSDVTKTGIFLGKLRYASPEHLGVLEDGERIDGRADLYSLALVLYEMLTGRPPFEAKSPHQYLMMHSRESQFRTATLPGNSELQPVLDRALQRSRENRYPSALEMAADLERIVAPSADADATLRLRDTLHRTTMREPIPAAPTVIEPVRRRRSPVVPTLLGVVIVVLIAIGTWALLHSPKPEPMLVVTSPAQPKPAQTSVVVTPPAPEPTVTTASMEPAPKPKPPTPEPKPAPEPVKIETIEPQREPEPPPTPAAGVYAEGGDSDANDRVLAAAQHALQGTTIVALRGSDAELTKELAKALAKANVAVNEPADVIVQFNGSLERLGRGRKRRSATATVTKHGRIVLRYEMAPEEYRVGDDPAEAFARVLLQAINP